MITALVAWVILTFGLTYLIGRAEIIEPLRVRLVAYVPPLASLLTCRACLSFWTGQAAAATVMGIASGFGAVLPWHVWLYLPPAAGVGGLGVIDIITFAKHGGTDGS